MSLLFSYGTLQQDTVQRSTFGRLLEGHKDELLGFEQDWVTVENPQFVAMSGKALHANARFNGKDESRLGGTVYEITGAELLIVDHYEQLAGYKRIEARLASGKHAWVYVDARSASPGS
jgi:gamma-glutamylcyclotransferase (GGCT)/AIG2-like uncharacterized protein YtfP